MTAVTTIKKATLQLGSLGSEVEELQRLLNRYDYHLPVNGVFGAWTENCVKDFQLIMFLERNGVVGPRTWHTLYRGAPADMPVLRLGSHHEKVELLQKVLSLISKSYDRFVPYYAGKIDGCYSTQTETAVKKFQKNSGLSGDGVVGDRTWYGLSKHSHVLYYVSEVDAV